MSSVDHTDMYRAGPRQSRLVATLLLILIGALIVLFVVAHGRIVSWVTTGPSQSTLANGSAAQAPELGIWTATGTVRSVHGNSIDQDGEVLLREWRVTRSCASSCSYILTRPVDDDGVINTLSARLTPGSDGWHATWPVQQLSCGGGEMDEQETWIIRFADNGTVGQADESSSTSAAHCGPGGATIVWKAALRTPGAGNDASV